MSNDFYTYFPSTYSGDIIFSLPKPKRKSGKKMLEYYKNAYIGNFKCHIFVKPNLPKVISNFIEFIYFLYKAIRLHYSEKFDIIVAYSPLKTGFIAWIVSKLIKRKFIVEVNGVFDKALLLDSFKITWQTRLKYIISKCIIRFVLKKADHIKLIFKDQVKSFNLNNIDKKSTCFAVFVPISNLKFKKEEIEPYILFLGFPWYLKGVDILIKAFNLISNEFHEYRLKIVGFCPDKSYFQTLAKGNDKIELCNSVPYDEAMKLMSRCTLFVLPSRTEAMGKVLLEAMASKKPIIASNVDGIPYYIKHGFNGLLFESENVEDLAEKIRIILSNPDYAKKLAENGYNYVHQHLSEERYVECYKKMIERVLSSERKVKNHGYSYSKRTNKRKCFYTL